MSSGMPELGSKISLISKADIRYEGRLFTVDPQECTIALASVRSFGTEDRETQYPVAPQNQVYDYILFRGSDIKDIRVLNNVPSLPNDPAIVQMSVPPSLGGGQGQGQYSGQYNHPVVGQTQYPQYHPMGGFPGSVHPQLNKTSELSPQTSVDLAPLQPVTAPIGSGVVHTNQVKDQGSMLDLIGGGSQQGVSRSGTPAVIGHRKSPTTDQGTQAGASGQERRNSSGSKQAGQTRPRPSSRTRQRQPSGSHNPPAEHMDMVQNNYNRGGWRGRSRGRGRGFVPRNKNTLKFEKDYDFEQANTQFEELRIQLAKTKIADGDVKTEGEVDKKDDSGNETGAGEAELEEHDVIAGYDKKKSFFDNISCEAVERSKGRSQRTDWRTERKLNSETFGVSSARRGAWRPRASWRHGPHPPHGHMHHPHPHPHSHPPAHPMSYFPSWRPMRGGRGRPNNNPNARRNTAPPPQTQPQPQSAAAK
ncbi:protein LSM14 homolog B isoform X2 [Danaus plexippus]|uniref:protein LSM14 homolog B isoform X2 n=1 Tax=Danaus plexippus TaxID=13037 RepID=UPI002AB2AF3B|nr:protein LSM14 homolog B isoform X2 [Danaus plexippus]